MKIRVLTQDKLNEFEVHRLPITVGREGNDLNVNDAHLSRKHALIYRDNQGFIRITDRDTTNGTYVNDVRVDDAQVSVGDRVLIGNVVIEVLSDRLNSALTGWPTFG